MPYFSQGLYSISRFCFGHAHKAKVLDKSALTFPFFLLVFLYFPLVVGLELNYIFAEKIFTEYYARKSEKYLASGKKIRYEHQIFLDFASTSLLAFLHVSLVQVRGSLLF